MQIANRDHLRDAIVRNGYLLPNAAFADVEYLDAVIQGTRWAPEYEHIKIRPCPRPPSKETLLKEVQDLLEMKGLPPIGDCTKKKPEMRFLLIALATLDLQYRFFHKNYIPPPRNRKREMKLPDMSRLMEFLGGSKELTNQQMRSPITGP